MIGIEPSTNPTLKGTMHITKETLDIFKNFSRINQSILIKEGNDLKTINDGRNVIGAYDSDETWPTETPIYDLGQFISCLQMFDQPSVNFHESHCDIYEGGNADYETPTIRFLYCDLAVMNKQGLPNDKTPTFPEQSLILNKQPLPGSTIRQINKTASILNTTFIKITAKDGKAFIEAADRNEDGNRSTIYVGASETDFSGAITLESFANVKDNVNYVISATSLGAIHLEAPLNDEGSRSLQYWITFNSLEGVDGFYDPNENE